MKKNFLKLVLAALTVGLLGSCSKINERIDGLDKRVYDLENNKIASVEQQIATINQSIADLSTIRTNIQTLMDAKTAMGEDITALKAADITLEGKINDLKDYVDTELAKYATKDWANATFATLTKQAEIITDVEKLKTGLVGLDTKLDQAIANLDSSLKGWVNEQLSGYYTIAQVDAKVDGIQSDIDALKTDNETNKTKIEELETSLTQLTQDLENAKTTIKAEYEKAIKDAIEGHDGYITETIKNAIDEANGKITALTGRVEALESDVATLKNDVDALKAMIQTVSIIPAYNNGSVKAEDGILTINCVITPKEAVDSLKKENFTILTSESEVLTKSALYGTLTIAKDEDLVLDKTNGTATIKVDVSSVLPAEEDKALTVAVNVKNGISDFTTEFVPVTNTTGGVRTIAVQFDNFTKATIDGFTPKFANGDAIRVSNTEKSEECTVSVDGSGNATFTTTLSGALTAIYPSAAAVLSSGEADAPIASSNNFKVLATQDGTVEKAIIASATVAEGENTATFNGLTALFEITPPSGATTFTITSLNKIDATTGRRSTTANAAVINTTGADDAAKRVITVTVPSDGTAYVALKAGVNLTDLSFDAGETYGMKGIPASKITGGLVNATAAKTKYTIDNQNWHPYVTIDGKKWATMNIGANSKTEDGYYFFWGGTVGYKRSGSNWVKADVTPEEVLNNGFVQANDPHYDNTNSKYTKYTDGKTVLELADDAAYVNWGGPWRMPTGDTSGEFQALNTAAPGSWTTESSVNGWKFTETSTSKTLFFPAAGYGFNTSLGNAGSEGYYWSSSFKSGSNAYYLDFISGHVYPQTFYDRYRGFSVRPVSD